MKLHTAFITSWLSLLASLSMILPLPVYSLTATTHAQEFGDYADYSYQCPYLTTCQRVCVSNVLQCPETMICNGTHTLCADGSCAEVCEEGLESPCANDCAKISCARAMDYYPSCLEKYGSYYGNETACAEEAKAATTHLFTFTEPAFIFLYAWISGVTVLVIGWCAYNQRFSPVAHSTKPLQVSTSTMTAPKTTPSTVAATDKKSSEEQVKDADEHVNKGSLDEVLIKDAGADSRDHHLGYQTGYSLHPMGLILNACVVATLLGIQLLLAWLCVQFYVQNGMMQGLRLVFEDEIQALLAFEIVWMVGFVWSYAFMWPHSIRSLFSRRCLLSEAGFVAVCVRQTHKDNSIIYNTRYIQRLRLWYQALQSSVRHVMYFVFSDARTFGKIERHEEAVFQICEVRTNPEQGTRYFVFMLRRYVLEEDKFVAGEVSAGATLDEIMAVDEANGLPKSSVDARRRVIGYNSIHIAEPNIFKTLWKQMTAPFYTYQVFIIWVWMNFFYYFMALALLFAVCTGLVVVTFFEYRNECNLYETTRITGFVRVIRDGETIMVPQEDLVPGDLMHVDAGLAFVDMLLVSGETALIDEGALTGEAHPVGKLPVDRAAGRSEYDAVAHKRSTILAGTTILESEHCRAVVLKTASFTARGELLRDIFTYRRHQFKFDMEVPVVLTILFFYAIFGFSMAFYWTGEVFEYGWFYGMLVVSATIPPLLPTVFTVSVGISDDRLARMRIACSHAESILVAGKVKRAFFDKTGTLTKQGLDYVSARSMSTWKDETAGISGDMALGMAACHSLTRTKTGKLIGNPVDQVMFDASGGSIDHEDSSLVTDCNGTKVSVVRHFEFDFHRMTQSVIVRHSDGNYAALLKGSSESIKDACTKSTLPTNFDDFLESSAKLGVYQLSMATKPISPDVDVHSITRDEVERNLLFAGCINFKNLIREKAPSVIQQLEEGEIESIMITGDSVLTGICIAKEAGIIKPNKKVLIGNFKDDKLTWTTEKGDQAELPPFDSTEMLDTQLAVTGRAWASLLTSNPEAIQILINYIRVFGRCNPRDKVTVVSEFVKFGYTTCMCGDGGNDCGALKIAHVGIALSDAEASIVAPFTSLDKDIESVVTVIREGRCSLASALAAYKFMIMYGQVETINQLINAYFGISFTEWCWIFMDGLWLIPLGFSLPLAQAASKLSMSRPTASLLGQWTLSSALGVLLINFLFTLGALSYLNHQDWYQCRKWEADDLSNVLLIGDNYESEVIFLITGFQYIVAAIIFNFGYEFRRAWIRNYVLVFFVAVFTTIHFYITLVPGKLSCVFHVNCENGNGVRGVVISEPIPIQNTWNTTIMPEDFRKGLIGLMVGNLLAACSWDFFVVNGIRRYYGRKKRLVTKAFEEASLSLTDEDYPGKDSASLV